MTRIMMIAITVFFCTSVHADTMNGKKLFDDAQCMKCHNTEDFKDKKIRKAKTFQQIKDKVSACQINHDVHWSDDEEHDVARYLNKEYYHFIEKK